MITKVIITNKFDAKGIVDALITEGKEVCWITISSRKAQPLVKRSTKDILVSKFDDKTVNPATPGQVRKIKNFILNHHVNNTKGFTLVVNCHAGVSRSAAVGKFCEHNLGLEVQFGSETYPNVALGVALGVSRKWLVGFIPP